jgi:hypothetical protein
MLQQIRRQIAAALRDEHEQRAALRAQHASTSSSIDFSVDEDIVRRESCSTNESTPIDDDIKQAIVAKWVLFIVLN